MLCNLPCRIVLVVLNTVTGLAGLVLLAFGALVVWGQDVLKNILNEFLVPLLQSVGSGTDAPQVTELVTRVLTSASPVGIVIFSVGAAISIASAIGYCGAYCNYKILLYVYAAIVGLLALIVLICFCVYFAKKDEFGDYVVKLFAESVQKYRSMQENNVDSLLVGLIQPPLKCCGIDGPADFKNMSNTDHYGGKDYIGITVPIPCCKMNDKYEITDPQCPKMATTNNSNIDQGCREPLKQAFIHYMNFAAYGLIATFIILIVLILFTILTICIDVV
ncbi:unnamed protein product [Dicrocoelium dendriticum]|nr:unnamed protein product [Dicrocoelium dendriticum]